MHIFLYFNEKAFNANLNPRMIVHTLHKEQFLNSCEKLDSVHILPETIQLHLAISLVALVYSVLQYKN